MIIQNETLKCWNKSSEWNPPFIETLSIWNPLSKLTLIIQSETLSPPSLLNWLRTQLSCGSFSSQVIGRVFDSESDACTVAGHSPGNCRLLIGVFNRQFRLGQMLIANLATQNTIWWPAFARKILPNEFICLTTFRNFLYYSLVCTAFSNFGPLRSMARIQKLYKKARIQEGTCPKVALQVQWQWKWLIIKLIC